ncbi:MAG: hypothetical protein GX352_06040 [Clostridiales bacterium]|nr:hypothetical protein [Clostridiales bacterium]
MKKKFIITAMIVLAMLLAAGSAYAWFTDSEKAENEFKMGTVKVKVLEEEFVDIDGVQIGKYDKVVQVQSLGSKKTYVRVRLIPQWSDPSLPVSNVELILDDNQDWIDCRGQDGYFYYKYYLTENQKTSPLLGKVKFTELEPEYDDAEFTLKVVAEGVQITHEAWKDVWGIDVLPFTADQGKS